MNTKETEMHFDILLVGGGPANLACSIHLMDLIAEHNINIKQGHIKNKKLIDIEDKIAIVEKGAYFGAHSLSGAIISPIAIEEIMPKFKSMGFPIESQVKDSSLYFLTKQNKYKLFFPSFLSPSLLNNKNNYLVSLGKISLWLSKEAEKRGVVLLPSYSGKEILYDKEDRVIGIKTDEKNWKDGKYTEPSYKLLAKVTLFGDGANGSLSQKLIRKLKLDKDSFPMTYELACKELWQIPKNRIEKGKVIYNIGYPLDRKRLGGSFIYSIDTDKVSIGMFNYLSSKDPKLNPHNALQELKEHPYLKHLLNGGKILSYGAKVVSNGGLHSIPKLVSDNALILGEAGGLLNIQHLKGIHLAIKSGAIAAKVLFEAIKENDFSINMLSRYEDLFYKSSAYKEIYETKHFTKLIDILSSPKRIFTFGTLLNKKEAAKRQKKDFETTIPLKAFYKKSKQKEQNTKYEKSSLTLDKLSSVYLSNTKHNEQEPASIYIKDKLICKEQCYPLFNAPCTSYCPANVYEVDEKKEIQLHFANCIHCKGANLKCPFDNIVWEVPQGGYGPRYQGM